jgi:hypothetical protein
MMKDENRKTAENGKGDAPRNNFSKEYRRNFAAINWKKKEQKPKQNTHKP